MRRLITGLALLVLAPGAALAQETRHIEPDDYYRVQVVGSPALSPDGRHLLYTVQTIRQEENDRITHIWWTDLQSGQSRRLSAQGVNSTNPNWTPDGRRIYFNTTRGNESGLHFLNFSEPGGEAYRIPGLTGGFTFHPSGQWVLVSRSVRAEAEVGETSNDAPPSPAPSAPQPPRRTLPSESLTGPQIGLVWPSGIPGLTGPTDPATRGKTEAERNNDVYVITHTNYKRDGTYEFVGPTTGGGGGAGGGGAFAAALGGGGGGTSYTQFFRISADGLQEGEEAVQITFDAANKSFQHFTPDGRFIVYTVGLGNSPDVVATTQTEYTGAVTAVYRVPATGGNPEELFRTRGTIRDVTLSPDGRRLAYVRTVGQRTDPFLQIVDLRSGREIEVGRDWVYGIGSLYWSSNSREVLWVSQVGGQDMLVKVAAEGGEISGVTPGRQTFNGIDVNPTLGRIAYVRSTPEEPWEAFVGDLEGRNLRQVSSINTAWREQVRLSRVEHFTFEGVPHNREWLDQLPRQGVEWMLANPATEGERFEIDAWLVYPPDYDPSQKYPLVLYIHGGPHSRYADTWFPEFQMVAAPGMFVLFTNPRGSSNYGMEFQYSTLRAWGIDDYRDVLQAVDIVVERGLADPERLGVTGGSYGGFMTNWITAHDQRFRTAVSDRAISNWLSFYGVSDASSLVEGEFGGMPWPFQSEEQGSYNLVMMLSPIVWADRVKTPTMIIHSINDYRTPLEGGEQWFRALKKHNVPVRMVLFPDTSHGMSRTEEPWLLVRRLQEYVNWFNAFLIEDALVAAELDAEDQEAAASGAGA
jgi:dipeptidyl aminopeptidase/acylaminoacyl peptidase